MSRKKAPDFCMTLKEAAKYLGFTNSSGKPYVGNYGSQRVQNLIASEQIKATVKTRGGSNTKNDWCVSFRSVEKWRIAN